MGREYQSSGCGNSIRRFVLVGGRYSHLGHRRGRLLWHVHRRFGCLGGGDCSGAGDCAYAVFPIHQNGPRSQGGGRRPPGSIDRRYFPKNDLGDCVVHRRLCGTGSGHYVGLQVWGAILAFPYRAEGIAGIDSGDFKTSYAADQQTFPIRFDRWAVAILCAFAFLVVPFLINDYWEKSVLLPFLVWAMAALGLNILTGYCGQVSLGTGGFMAVGAYASYKLTTSFPELNLFIVVLMSGGVTAMVGILFGLPSLRKKGFYLAVATLAAQFFLVWLFNKVPWFYN